MIDAGIPVIDMDTLIAPLDTIDVLTFLAPSMSSWARPSPKR
jgi:ribose transport system substrate-binding protein